MAKRTKVWTLSEGAASWNVRQAEEDIWQVKRHGFMFKQGEEFGDKLFAQLFKGRPEYAAKLKAAALEMNEVLDSKDNGIGYHLNHIKSGKPVYSVFQTDNSKAYKSGGFFDTKEEADAAAAGYGKDEAYVEEIDDTEGRWAVWVLDEDETEHLKQAEYGGEWVGDYDTEEEAEAEMNAFSHAYIMEGDAEEWWAVIDNKTGKHVYGLLFPTETRALAFLYNAAKPKAFMEYMQACYGEEA